MVNDEGDPREVVMLQVRLLLYKEGAPGSLTIRRAPDGGRRIEIEYAGKDGNYSVRGSLSQVGSSLARAGLEFHQL